MLRWSFLPLNLLVNLAVQVREVSFPSRKGQLEFTGSFTLNEPIRVTGPSDFIQG